VPHAAHNPTQQAAAFAATGTVAAFAAQHASGLAVAAPLLNCAAAPQQTSQMSQQSSQSGAHDGHGTAQHDGNAVAQPPFAQHDFFACEQVSRLFPKRSVSE
jgi:hypothetical protein